MRTWFIWILVVSSIFMTVGQVAAQDDCPMGAVAAEAPVITFGATVSQTGDLATEGQDVYNGYLLWEEWVNTEHGGINVDGVCHQAKIIFYDDESDRAKVTELTTKLIEEDQVDFMLSPYSTGLVGAASEVSEAAGVLMVQGNGASETLFERGYQNFFGILTPASLYTRSGIELAASLGAKTAVLAYEDSAFSISVAQGAEQWLAEFGIQLLAAETYPEGADDVTAMFTRFQELNPDLVIGGGHFNDAVLFIQTAQTLGFEPEAFLITVGPSSPAFVEQLGADAEGVWSSTQWASSMGWSDEWFGTAAEYAERYETRFEAEPSYQAAQSTATALVLQIAIETAASTETEAVRTALQGLEVVTFYGPVQFDETGKNIAKPMATTQIQNGEIVVIAPAEVAVAEAVYSGD